MMEAREAIAVAIVAVYTVWLTASLLVNVRQGFARQTGFLYLTIFCILRIAGGAMTIVSHDNPGSVGDAEWAAILSSIGLSPLFLATSHLLKRVNDLARPGSIHGRICLFLSIPCVLALVLAIIGGTRLSETDPSSNKSAFDFLKAASIIFVIVLIGLVGIATTTASVWQRIPKAEKRIFMAILLAFPLLTVRTIYSLLVDYVNNHTFYIFGGNAYAQLGMSVVEEMIVTLLFLVVGLTTPSMQQELDQKEQLRGGMPLYQRPMQENGVTV